ncbi:sensor histidine kinase [Dactylosporangium vinaceum]|uniref:histidine kinase n=1 Tax=Dactylosporangium vinaceum TaxID=53362 RepID=A0ABV5MR41_9ACTN|nr:histidine kinase [Dactylosporangium vinaceum]UAC00561.1 sensor histidine kinase [Dactylosporangium vinaceum]
MRRLSLLALKVPAVLLLALPPLALTHLYSALTFPSLVALVAGSRGLARTSRRLQGIETPYAARPPLQQAHLGWYFTGYDYHRRRVLAVLSLWFNWIGRDPATWRDLAWLGTDPLVGTVLLLTSRLGRHARWTRVLLAPTGTARLGERVRELTDSRAEALDAQAAELERIERDLHDGAQARLVAIGLTLSLAQRALRERPDEADALLSEARATASDAVRQLRDLVHGIRPPVLTERGLVAALELLALEHPLRVGVAAQLTGRLPAPLESAVYFAASELLTNAAKHARGSTVEIGIVHNGESLVVTVTDDGIGGADTANGTGLAGVRKRLRAFDGTLTVGSPPGGPTVITMEVPCALSSPRTSTC